MQLREWLAGLAASGVLGGAGFVFVDWLEEQWPWFYEAEAWLKRLVAYVVTGVVGSFPYLAMVAMGYEPRPENCQAWIEALFAYLFVAVVANQGVHIVDKTVKDRRRAKELAGE